MEKEGERWRDGGERKGGERGKLGDGGRVRRERRGRRAHMNDSTQQQEITFNSKLQLICHTFIGRMRCKNNVQIKMSKTTAYI